MYYSENEEIKVVIPSYKRAERVKSKILVPNPIICVSESEFDEYKHYNPECEIVTHPDSVKGLIPKRNWMMNHFEELFMIDDDVDYVSRFYTEDGDTLKQRVTDPHYIQGKINELYDLAKMVGAPLFGFAKQSHPTSYRENWFSLSHMITGCAYGIIKQPDLYWNEELKLKEDFWISCLVKYKYRKILTDRRFFFKQSDTFVNQGGLSEFRNNKTEMNNILELRRTFGEVVKKKASTGKNSNDKIKNNINVVFGF